MLFYHLKLRCYVVIELKACDFEPGFVSQLNMYQNAVNDIMRHSDDKPTICSNNLYQIFTYVKNRSYQFGEVENTVLGMLLYAKTEEEIQPDNVYRMHGSQISVKTLDLNLPFVDIASQLDRIVELHFAGLTRAY